MKIQDLRYYIAIMEHQNLSKAATELFVAQPFLSRKLAEIEKIIGVKLFKRSTRNIEPTNAGTQFYYSAKKIVNEYDNAIQELHRYNTDVSGEIKIGYNPINGCPPYFFETVREMIMHYPSVKMYLKRLYPAELIESLETGDIDCCFLGERYTPDIEIDSIYLHSATFLIYTVHGHPLAKKNFVSVSDLKGYPFVVLNRKIAPVLHDVTLELIKMNGDNSKILYVDDIDEAKIMISTGKFISALSSDSLVGEDRRFIKIPIKNYTRNDYRRLIWKSNTQNDCLPLYIEKIKAHVSL